MKLSLDTYAIGTDLTMRDLLTLLPANGFDGVEFRCEAGQKHGVEPEVAPAERRRVKALLDRWYRAHARRVFQERLDACYPRAERLGAPYPEIAIRVMRTRWGSCSSPDKIALNLKLIQVPKHYIDYVVMHELCHLLERNHSPRFRELLDRAMPDWRERKRKLDEYEFG